MWHNLQRFTLGAILLASLSLFLFGCGTGSGTPAPPVTKTISGIVSDPTTGLPISNATVSAYGVDASGKVASTPISIPATTQSDGWGQYSLKIPMSYTGAVLVQATVGNAKAVIAQKQVAAAPGGSVIRALLPSIFGDATVQLNLATEMVYEYIILNKGGVFNAANVHETVLMLEPFFGPNFTQVPPPAFDNAPTQAQENLVVAIQAVNSMLSPTVSLASLVTLNPATGKISLGDTANLATLNAKIATATADLTARGTVASTYIAPTITPLTQTTVVTSLSDTTPPSGPTVLTYDGTNSTYNKVIVTWDAATDNVGVTAYYVYRDGALIAVVAAPALTYSDATVTDSTTYTYNVLARDAAGNLSAGTSKVVTTKAIPTFTISGKITFSGAALANVSLTLTGSGNGATTTDASGNYSFTGVRAGNYSITPALAGYFFAPAFKLVSVTTTNATAQDFTAVQSGSISGGTTYPDGTVTSTTTYPDGTVVTTTTYPTGTVVTTTKYPSGTVATVTTYPNGTVTTATTYADGTATVVTIYSDGTVTTVTTYPNGTVTTGTTYPNGTSTVVTNYPNGTVTTTATYTDGSVTTTTTYPNGMVTTTTNYAPGTVGGGAVYPTGSVSGTLVSNYVIVYGTLTDTTTTLPATGIYLVFTDQQTGGTTTVKASYVAASTPPTGTYYFSFIGIPTHTYTYQYKLNPLGALHSFGTFFTVKAPFDINGNLKVDLSYP